MVELKVDSEVDINEVPRSAASEVDKSEVDDYESITYQSCGKVKIDDRRLLRKNEPDHVSFDGKYATPLDGNGCWKWWSFAWLSPYIKNIKHGGIRQYDLHKIKPSLGLSVVDEYYRVEEEVYREAVEKNIIKKRKIAAKALNCKGKQAMLNLTQDEIENGFAVYIKNREEQILKLPKVKQFGETARLQNFKKSFTEQGIRNNLIRIVLRMSRKPFGMFLMVTFICNLIFFVSPITMQYLMDFVQKMMRPDITDKPEKYVGFVWVAALFASKIFSSITESIMSAYMCDIAMKAYTVIMGVTYDKLLKITDCIRTQIGSGTVNSFVTTDIQKITIFYSQMLNFIVEPPLQIIFSIIYAVIISGPWILIGVATIIVILPLGMGILASNLKIIKMLMNTRDSRLSKVTEILHGIRVIKFFADEELHMARIAKIRRTEVNLGRIVSMKFYLMNSIYGVGSSIMFSVYAIAREYTGSPIDNPASSIVSFSLFDNISVMLMFLPMAFSNLMDCMASSNRIKAYLNLPLGDKYIVRDPSNNGTEEYNDGVLPLVGDEERNNYTETNIINSNNANQLITQPILEVRGRPSFTWAINTDRNVDPALDPNYKRKLKLKSYILTNHQDIYNVSIGAASILKNFLDRCVPDGESSDEFLMKNVYPSIAIKQQNSKKISINPKFNEAYYMMKLLLTKDPKYEDLVFDETRSKDDEQYEKMLEKLCYDVRVKQFTQISDFEDYDYSAYAWNKHRYESISLGSVSLASVIVNVIRQNNLRLKPAKPIHLVKKLAIKPIITDDLSVLERELAAAIEYSKLAFAHAFITDKLYPLINNGIVDDLEDTIKHLELKLYPGECVGVMGPVSSGKTSLLSALMGQMRVSNTDNGRNRMLNGKEDEVAVIFNDKVTYYSSTPAVFTGTVRDNILFGAEYDEERYNKVLDLCCLRQDLEIMDSYDMTPVGESAGTLSGGQKARVMLARCAYSKAKIVLLDDCLSAVDAHVGFKIWNELITGFMREERRTVLICTHQTHYFLAGNGHLGVDRVITIDKGELKMTADIETAVLGSIESSKQKKKQLKAKGCNFISSQSDTVITTDVCTTTAGSGSEVSGAEEGLPKAGNFTNNIGIMTQLSKTKNCNVTKEERNLEDATATGEERLQEEGENEKEAGEKETVSRQPADTGIGNGTFTAEQIEQKRRTLASLYTEEKKTGNGSISCKTYRLWCKELRYTGFIVYMIFIVVSIGLYFFQTIELQEWATKSSDMQIFPLGTSSKIYLWVFVGCTFASMLFSCLAGVVIAFNWFDSTRRVGEKMMSNIMHSPVRYFDVTPTGRLINRLSRDLDSLESMSMRYLSQTVFSVVQLVGILITIAISSYMSLIVLVPCLIVFFFLLIDFRKATPELKRVEAILKSPILAQISETNSGIGVIQASEREEDFKKEYRKRVENNITAFWALLTVPKWVQLRSAVCANFISLAAGLSIVVGITYLPNTSFGAMAGSTLSSSLIISYICSNTIVGLSQFELEFASFEVIRDFCNLKPESSWDRPRATISEAEQRVLTNKLTVPTNPGVKIEPWMKEAGELKIRNLKFRYRPELPLVLHNITMTVNPGEKIGIVGRTGNGKSSTINALFRINEPEPGSTIEFNGHNVVEDVGLHQLRKTFSIVPQEPWLIEGTLRQNIDPVMLARNENVDFYRDAKPMPDEELWELLSLCKIRSFVESQPGGLDMYISDNGSNLSSGFRQMICVAKAIQRKAPVVILDEATASLDKASDKAVQDAINTALKGITTLAIAHRLDTIIGYDRVCVINKGEVAEYDTPAVLLRNENSIFYSLCKRTGEKSFRKLYDMAFEAETKRIAYNKGVNSNDFSSSSNNIDGSNFNCDSANINSTSLSKQEPIIPIPGSLKHGLDDSPVETIQVATAVTDQKPDQDGDDNSGGGKAGSDIL